jgi:hypothetical protein
MFITVGVLALALAAMAITDSAIPGWIAAVAVFAWMVGRIVLWTGGPGPGDDLDVDL